MNKPHEFVYPKVTEYVIPHYVPEHDDFGDQLELNYEVIEPADVALFALHLIGKGRKPGIDTSGMEFVPEGGRLMDVSADNHIPSIPKTPDNAEVSSFPSQKNGLVPSSPIIPDNVYYLFPDSNPPDLAA